MKKAQSGFTLMEVLVAITILGVTLGGFMMLLARQTRTHSDLQDRMLAGIVAENVLVEQIAIPGRSDVGTVKGIREMGGREWAFAATAINLQGVPGQSVTVTVQAKDSDYVIARLIGVREVQR